MGTDKRIPLVVTYGLVLISVLGLVAVTVLVMFERNIPDMLNSMTSAALGGLTALLASTRSEPGPV